MSVSKKKKPQTKAAQQAARRIKARKAGYKSLLEYDVSEIIRKSIGDVSYETSKIEWMDLAFRIYTPDFTLPNGILIETKGKWDAADRRKHLAIKKQYPNVDIRFIFQNSKKRLTKSSQTTYAAWCIKYGFRYTDADQTDTIREWLKEPKARNKTPVIFLAHPQSTVRRKYDKPKRNRRRTRA